MKYFAMTDHKGKPVQAPRNASGQTESAFDIWLNRSLHQLYDDVAQEPVPEELLRLIQNHEKK